MKEYVPELTCREYTGIICVLITCDYPKNNIMSFGLGEYWKLYSKGSGSFTFQLFSDLKTVHQNTTISKLIIKFDIKI